MPTVGIRDLARNTSRIVKQVRRSGRPVLVTSHGRPEVAVVPIDPDRLEDWILDNAPSFAADMREAEKELDEGRARPAAEVFAEVEGED